MKIEAGKYYRTRDGRKVGPMTVWEGVYERDTDKPLYDCETVGGIRGAYWRENGLNSEPGLDPDPRLDLIAEWQEGPVRSIEDLTAAIETLTQVRDALKEMGNG